MRKSVQCKIFSCGTVHVLNFQRDVVESLEYVPQLMILRCIDFLIIHFCDLRMAHSGPNMSLA